MCDNKKEVVLNTLVAVLSYLKHPELKMVRKGQNMHATAAFCILQVSCVSFCSNTSKELKKKQQFIHLKSSHITFQKLIQMLQLY